MQQTFTVKYIPRTLADKTGISIHDFFKVVLSSQNNTNISFTSISKVFNIEIDKKESSNKLPTLTYPKRRQTCCFPFRYRLCNTPQKCH